VQYLITMSTTVAVALITSLSTLLGGLIGSVTSLFITNNQSRKERLEKRREIRRDAYVQFLNKFDEVVVLLDKCWARESGLEGSESDEMKAVARGLDELENAMNTAQLEGPAEIVDIARKVYDFLGQEFDLLLLITKEHRTSSRPRFELSDGKYFEARDSRITVKRKFIDAARSVLD
jgi:gas vesicle protein